MKNNSSPPFVIWEESITYLIINNRKYESYIQLPLKSLDLVWALGLFLLRFQFAHLIINFPWPASGQFLPSWHVGMFIKIYGMQICTLPISNIKNVIIHKDSASHHEVSVQLHKPISIVVFITAYVLVIRLPLLQNLRSSSRLEKQSIKPSYQDIKSSFSVKSREVLCQVGSLNPHGFISFYILMTGRLIKAVSTFHLSNVAAITWYKDARPLSSTAGVSILKRGQVLEIDRVQVADAGLYRCVAVNVAGTAELAHSLQVYGEHLVMGSSLKSFTCSFWMILSLTPALSVSPSISSKGGTVTVVVNEPVKLECEASGLPLPSLTWLKEGSPVSSSSNGIQVCGHIYIFSIWESLLSRTTYRCASLLVNITTLWC